MCEGAEIWLTNECSIILTQSRKRNGRIAQRNLETKKCEIEYEQEAKSRKTGCVENRRRGRESG